MVLKWDFFTRNGGYLKSVDKFTYLSSSFSSTENYISMRQQKTWTAIDRLSFILISDRCDRQKRNFFQVAAVPILLYGCIKWTLTKRIEKKLSGNCTRMLRAILNRFWKHYPTKQLLCGHLPPIPKTIKISQTRTLLEIQRRTRKWNFPTLCWPTSKNLPTLDL